MSRAFVLMTAMPPTRGHASLIQFASHIGTERARVIVCTQPEEPYTRERFSAVHQIAYDTGADAVWMHRTLLQDPSVDGFWPQWDAIMTEYGFRPGDYVVSSEPYGATVAERNHGIFMPFDPKRELIYTKGTLVRDDPHRYFTDIAPQFQNTIRQTVTIFGAESTGKTTLSKMVAKYAPGHWAFEYARPYLETVGKEITVDKMKAIWYGQKSLQQIMQERIDKPWIVQDTDLFSTVGYWEQPHWESELGKCPEGLIKDAIDYASDLYLITQANIPFEQDDIRYGDGVRESPDQYWIDLCELYDLNYVVLDGDHPQTRINEALGRMNNHWRKEVAAPMFYDRQGL